ncbi:MAG: ubiquinone/menaquinone biosynthesis methyltransferase [Anaerolineae bacterium]|nr:ubiquinone/menaquinone biosynthesis methyltransferase [Thermoflexales bacterium]MDW8053390.1 ubiquinone/menaquinone biosynthesis methyltransferase [Anaerolineae bacterium]
MANDPSPSKPGMPLPLAPAEHERAQRVRALFGRITRRYDLMNRLMTAGRDQAWRRAAARALGLNGTARVLDLATGTGDLAFAVREVYPQAHVVAMDFSEVILREGVRKARARCEHHVAWAVGDALALPFPDGVFDGCTNAFLLRNVVNLELALREMRRVVKPGGRVVCMEITHPQTPIFRELFWVYFGRIVPLIGGAVAGDLQAYAYLPHSLSRFPAAEPLRRIMLAVGFREVHYRLLGLGAMAIHVGIA